MTALVIEGRRTREKDECYDANGPDIDLVVVGGLCTELGSHVEGAAEGQCLLLVLIVLRCKTKIGQLDPNIFIIHVIGIFLAQDIFRLQISVHDVFLVHVVQS